MDTKDMLPFEVGQLAEAKSFLQGYRGAWFRCKIKEISWRNGYMAHLLEYFDFPDEKEKWTKLYQVAPISLKRGIRKKRELMVRPPYPPIYHESEMPHADLISEVRVISDGTWKVGDLVDWLKDHCYWSGIVTQVLGNGTAKIELTPPPMGEGSSYEVSFQDLRPSLDWSPEIGWTVGETCRQCARLVHPGNQVESNPASRGHLMLQMPARRRISEGLYADGLSSALPLSSHIGFESVASTDELRMRASGTGENLKEPSGLIGTPETNVNRVLEDNGTGKTICSSKSSGSHVTDDSAETDGRIVEEDLSDSSCPMKTFRTSGRFSLNSLHSDTLDAAFMDLEELANKIRWLKGLLKDGISISDATRSPWKFLEHRASSIPK